MSDNDKAITPRQPPWPAPLVAPLPPDGHFAKNEEWAWARIANGLIADMAYYPGDETDPNGKDWLDGQFSPEPDPKDSSTFKPQHKLTELFLRTILFHEPWASASERPGVDISNALIEDPIDWSERETKGALWFFRCRFAQDVVCRRIQVRGTLSLQACVLAGELNLDRAHVGSNLFCREGTVVEGNVLLIGAHIEGNAEFDGATLKGALFSDSLRVDCGLFLRQMRRLGPTDLIASQIGRDLHIHGSEIEGEINLTGATIAGELHLDRGWDNERKKDTLPTWGDGVRLILRNASATSIAGRLDAFRRQRDNKNVAWGDFVDMDLTGFRYQNLGGLDAAHKDTLAAAEAEHLIAWLEAGSGDGAFNPDPYRQLARALEASGHMGKARRILRAMAGHEHRAAKGWRRVPFFFSWLFIRYGYSNLTALVWFVALVLVFTAWGLSMEGLRGLDFSPAGFAEFFRWLGFSFANAIPLMSFDKAHETFLAAQFGHGEAASVPVAIAWAFYLEKVAGFIILTYLAAGLSGLAHRRVEEG